MAKKAKETRKRTSNDAVSRAQIRTLIDGIDNPRDHLMVNMGVHSGCRVNELANLTLDKIDFAQGFIVVWDDKKNQWSWKRDEITGKKVRNKKLTEGKWRKIKMPSDVMDELKAYIKQYPNQSGRVWDLHWSTWEKIIHKWSIQLLGVNKSWHFLRHCYITLHFTAGSPIGFVKAQTGDTAATILRVYDNPTPDVIEENAEKKLF